MDVKAPTHPAGGSRRERRIRATRATVADAARQLFLQRGYVATTIEEIARLSNTPLATLYRLFGSKRGILTEIIEVSAYGDDEPISVHHRALAAERLVLQSDPRGVLEHAVRTSVELLERSGPIYRVLVSASTVDADCVELLATTDRLAHEGLSNLASVLAEQGALREDISQDDAADTMHVLMGPGTYDMLTRSRGWSPERYGRWLLDLLCKALLKAQDIGSEFGHRQ